MKYGELFRLLKQKGWYEIRQSGSHVIMQHPEKKTQLPVPFQSGKEVTPGLLPGILPASALKTTKR